MSELIERLAAADPVAGAPYVHADLAAMTQRIMQPARPRPGRVLRAFQLRMAASAAAASLVTLGAIAALNSAVPNLSVLALATPNQVATGVSSAPLATATATKQINAGPHFVAGPAISSGSTSGPAVRLDVPKDPLTEVGRIADAFSLSGSPTQRTGDVSTWDVRGSSGALVSYSASAVPPRWTYSNGSLAPVFAASPPVGPGAITLTTASAVYLRRATHYVDRLGLNLDLGRPSVTWTSDPNLPVTAQPPLDRQVVSFPVNVGGVETDQVVVFMFDTNAKLLWASGPDFNVSASYSYPLVSPVQSVNRLNSLRNSTTPLNAPSNRSNITLMTETLSLRTFQLADGTEWMLPTYDFSQVAGTSATRWWTVAVEPRYLRADPASMSGELANGPINY